MESEIKSRVFAQYIGQKILFAHQKTWVDGMFCTPSTLNNIESGLTNHTNLKLILKPLPAITQEDAKGLYKAIGYGFKSFKFILEILQALPFNEAIIAYQYLVSKGYDLPNHLLDGKTLFECGLAIYENQQV